MTKNQKDNKHAAEKKIMIPIPKIIRTALMKLDMMYYHHSEFSIIVSLHTLLLCVNLIELFYIGAFKPDFSVIMIILQFIHILVIVEFAFIIVFEIFRLVRVEELYDLRLRILSIFLDGIQIVLAILFLHFL